VLVDVYDRQPTDGLAEQFVCIVRGLVAFSDSREINQLTRQTLSNVDNATNNNIRTVIIIRPTVDNPIRAGSVL